MLARPAGRLAVVKAIAKPKAKGKAKAKAGGRKKVEVRETEWIPVEDLREDSFELLSTVQVHLWYAGETGEMAAILEGLHSDREGKWLCLKVLGTTLAAVRDWKKSNPEALFYCCRVPTPVDRRLTFPGIGYTMKIKTLTQETDWSSNALEEVAAEQATETDQLKRAAEKFGFHQPELVRTDEPVPEKKEPAKPSSSSKKKTGKRKVKEMLEKSRWKMEGTPLDPDYKRPIKLSGSKKKKKKDSSTTSSDRSSSPTSDSSEVLDSDHRLRKIAQKLPGYLARRASRQAATTLSQSTGEGEWGVGVYRRYYRQILHSKVSSKAILREMLTLCSLLDTILDGQILTVADIAAQRLKSLELLASGSPVELASQLEILPKDLTHLAGQEEARYAQKEFQNENKLQRQLKGTGKWNPAGKDHHPPPLPPQETKGGWKGGKPGKWQAKGGKAPQSKITEVKD